MVISQDTLGSFIPNQKPKMVIMGTMVAICARTLNGEKPETNPLIFSPSPDYHQEFFIQKRGRELLEIWPN